MSEKIFSFDQLINETPIDWAQPKQQSIAELLNCNSRNFKWIKFNTYRTVKTSVTERNLNFQSSSVGREKLEFHNAIKLARWRSLQVISSYPSVNHSRRRQRFLGRPVDFRRTPRRNEIFYQRRIVAKQSSAFRGLNDITRVRRRDTQTDRLTHLRTRPLKISRLQQEGRPDEYEDADRETPIRSARRMITVWLQSNADVNGGWWDACGPHSLLL